MSEPNSAGLPNIPIPEELPGGPAIGVLPKPVLVGKQPETIETLSLDELFAVVDTRYETFSVDGWPKPLTIGSLTSGELNAWMEERDRPGDDLPLRRQMAGFKLFAMSYINPDGTRVEKDRITLVAELLKAKNSKNIDAVFERIKKLNGLDVGDNVIKNVSSGTTIAASRTSSPRT